MKKILFLITVFILNSLFGQKNEIKTEKKENHKKINITIPSGVKVEVSGEVEMEFINVEGPGGAQNQDELTQKVKIRSPHTRIDKAVLNLKLLYSKKTSYKLNLRFNDEKAYADKNYFLHKQSNFKLEIGKNKPKIAAKRKTEGYPLLGTAFWRGREYHADFEYFLKNFNLKLATSIALKRPLGYDNIAEDKSFKILVYDDYSKTDGQTIEYGLRGLYSINLISLSGWYYTGKLMDDVDWGLLHSDFISYSELDNNSNSNININHYWYGGRVDALFFGTSIRAEHIKSIDGFLSRNGFYTELRKDFSLPILPKNTISFLARYGELKLNLEGKAFYPDLENAHTWDRQLTTLATAYSLNKNSKIKIEYYIINEETGDTVEFAELENRTYQPSTKDNHLLIQLEFTF